ncbi:hypothetical protein BKA63DRAFT_554339 [Paraphoma chrysanthemicola]|nr:hypothetical protein BKA63DRAFT_554339 [Paraphoma chrysanthemicola]
MSKTSVSPALDFQPQATSNGRSLQLPVHPTLAEDSTPITTGIMPIATPISKPTDVAALDQLEQHAVEDCVQKDASAKCMPHGDSTVHLRTLSASNSTSVHPLEPTWTPALVHPNRAQQIVSDAPTVPHKHCAPQQGQILSIDVGNQQPDDAVKLLDVQTLNDLHHLDAASTIDLQQTLVAARHAHHVQLSMSEEQRSALLSTLSDARNSELVHDENIRRLNENFIHELNASFKLSGEPRATAQRTATLFLDKARDESQLAYKDRDIIESCREKLLSLDNERIVAANALVNTVHAVVTRALSGQALHAVSTTPKANRKTASSSTSISSDVEAGAQAETENAGISEDCAELKDDLAARQQAELEEDLAAKRLAELEQCPDIDRRSVDDAMARIFHAKADTTERPQGVKKAISVTMSRAPAIKDDGIKDKAIVVTHANEDNAKETTMA